MSDFIGVLSLDTRFPRIKGDAGNPESYDLPAVVRIIDGAGPENVVCDGKPAPELVSMFRKDAEALVAEGARLITSTCGFLISVQDEISKGLGVPVLLSGLCVLPIADLMFGGGPFGVLTANSSALGRGAIEATGIPYEKVRLQGLQDYPLFAGTFLATRSVQNESFSFADMEAEVVASARALVERCPEIVAIVLECGNLPPYASTIQKATGKYVFSILDAVRLMTR